MFGLRSQESSKSLIAIVTSEQARSEIQFIMAKLPEVNAAIKLTENTLQDSATLVNGSADVVIIEADLSDPNSIDVLKRLCNYVSRSGSLIVLAENVTPANTRLLFKSGVNDVLSLPINRNELLLSLESAFGEQVKNHKEFEKSGKVITFVKCGGGVGATTMATNIGHQLMLGTKAKTSGNKRKDDPTPQGRVAIFDFDIQFGTVGLSLNVDNKTDILDVRKAEDRLDASLLNATIRQHESGLNILSSPEEIVPFDAFSPEFFEELIGISKAIFDYIVIDMPQAWTDWTQTVLAHSDLVLPVLTPSVENVHNGQKILQALAHMKIKRDSELVLINRISKSLGVKNRVAQIQKLTDRPTILMREDVKTHSVARDRGVLLHNVSRSAGTLKNLTQCTQKIVKHLQMQGENTGRSTHENDANTSILTSAHSTEL